ncbi:MAG: ribosome biogenesis GTPase Der [candidate division KSB1 bacterium]|nr:ribosome biogenesis GTPase Der [candidate division KSB1 bacterium]MDZ7302257.1 ribosome biogenesis GTPase Der [candidate division KSB1 bacterium]MDZ7311363.1 ribosome biogenesis GTPase Der [candidate division KSB1 bacterium]
MKKTPLVAIIGRPNVGKSTLFNRIIRKREAIVHETPGVTRDRNYAEADWAGYEFTLVDTGGYFSDSDNAIDQAVLRQVNDAIDEAEVVVFVVDARTGVTAIDAEIARILRQSEKALLLAVNKIDDTAHEPALADFYALGLGDPVPISAASGRQVGDFLDRLVALLPVSAKRQPRSEKEDKSDKSEALYLAVIGRPNVGKSSFVNAVLGHEQVIVTEIPGTTRDAIDTRMRYKEQEIVLIDTAGLRKTSRVKEAIEYYSTVRTRESIRRCHVAIVLLDALEKAVDQDLHIVSEAARLQKGIVVGVNKWDLIEKDASTARQFEKELREALRIYSYVPILFISAITRQRVFKLLDVALAVQRERQKQLRTAELNEFLQEAVRNYPPPSMEQREVKIKYCTQVKHAPPVIAFYCNHPTAIRANYRQYLENRLRARFGFTGVPLTLNFRKK